ncbi:MAG: hypothetical protein WC222_06420 [Parachlamydiales bacterium]|jgi:hypothetical protein
MFTTVDEKKTPETTNAPNSSSCSVRCPEKNLWWGRSVDVVQKFGKTFGCRMPLLLGFIPTFTLLVSSTQVKYLVTTSSFGFLFTVVIQHIWQYFDRANNKRIDQEVAWCERYINNADVPKEPGPEDVIDLDNPNTTFTISSYLKNNRPFKRIEKEDSDSDIDRDEFINSMINLDLDEDFQKHSQNIDNFFGDLKGKLELQAFLDKFGELICKVQDAREKQQLVSEKSSQQVLEDANSCSQAFKGMALGAKICKELGRLGKEGNLKFKGEELLKALHENYYNAISFSKFNIEIFIIGVEYFCLYTRNEEIQALSDDILELQTQLSILERDKNLHKPQYVEACRNAIGMAIQSIEIRIKHLGNKNNAKQREITFDIFESALSGSQDLFELIRERTNFFSNFPKVLNWLIFFDAGVGVFISLVSFVFNLTKVCLSKMKFENAGIDETYCKKLLENYRQSLREKYLQDFKVEPSEEDLIDNYTRFLDLKIKVLGQSKINRIIHIIEKIIKISDDLTTLTVSAKLLITLVGISLGAPMTAVLTTATTTVTFLSLGSGIYRFTRKLYSQRHRIAYAIEMIRLRSLRVPQFERLEKSYSQLNETLGEQDARKSGLLGINEDLKELITSLQSKKILTLPADRYTADTQSAELSSILSNPKMNIDMMFSMTSNEKIHYETLQRQKQEHQEVIYTLGTEIDRLCDASHSTRLCYLNTMDQVKIVRDNLFASEMADDVATYTANDIVTLRNLLNSELGLLKKEDFAAGQSMPAANFALNKAIWGERLRELGHYTMKPITGELILKYAFSTQFPVTKASKQNLKRFHAHSN